jgi:hypothetical protein
VALDRGGARKLVAALARERASAVVRPGGLAPSLAVVESSFQEELSLSSAATDVNAGGVTVGRGVAPSPDFPPPLTWPTGSLSPMFLTMDPDWVDGQPAAISDGGQIAGTVQVEVSEGSFRSRAVRWAAGGAGTALPPPAGLEDDFFGAVDIAPNGDVLGYKLAPFPPAVATALLWRGSVPSDVGVAGLNTVPIAINAAGVILATVDFGGGPAVRRTDGTWVPLPVPEGWAATFATDLGSDGTVVGGTIFQGGYRIVRWAPDGTPALLDPPGQGQTGFASAINMQGTLLLTIFDPGVAHPVAYLLNQGDYSPLPSDPPAAESATWDLTLEALSDGNVAVGTWHDEFSNGYGARWTIHFANEAPTASAGGSYSGVEGSPIAFAGSAFDPTPTGTLSAGWSLGDGGSASGLTPTYAYGDNGSYTATLTVSDGEFSVQRTAQVTVTNATPVISVPAADTATAGESYALAAGFTDPGLADGPWAYVVNWGDGGATTQGTRSAAGAIPASRTYKQAGSFTIRVTVRDKDGATGSASFPLVVLKRNGRPR